MKRIPSFLISIALVSQGAVAADIEILERVFPLVAAVENAASANYDAACSEWKANAKAVLGSKAIYSTCGAKKTGALITQYSTEDPFTYYDENGNLVSSSSTTWHTAARYGYTALSDGKLLVTVPGNFQRLEEELLGVSRSCTVKGAAGCLDARTQAQSSFVAECAKFKATAAASFDARFIYASCGIVKNGSASNAGNVFQYTATGTIYFSVE